MKPLLMEGILFLYKMKKQLILFLSLAFILSGISFISASWNSSMENGLKDYYTLDETTGTNLLNYANYSGNGTTTGGPAHVPGKINNGLEINYPNPNTEYFRRTPSHVVTGNWTISFWANMTSASGIILSNDAGSEYIYLPSTTSLIAKIGIGSETATIVSATNTWQHYVISYDYDNSAVYIYQNGTLVLTGGVQGNMTVDWFGTFAGLTAKFEGRIDEIGIWNRTFSQDEVNQLYNSGSGISPLGASFNLISPSDNAIVPYGNQTFNCSATTISPIANISFYTNKTGVWELNQTSLIGGSPTYYNPLFGLNITNYSSFDWTCSVGYTDGSYEYFTDNRTVNFRGFNQTGISYSAITLEGSNENFTLTGTTPSPLYISQAYLIYNGTSYSSSWSSSAGIYTISNNLIIPDVPQNTTKNFYFNLILSNGEVFNTSNYYQTVYFLSADNCSTYGYEIYNFTLLDEASQTFLTGGTYNNSLEFDMQLFPLGSSSAILNFSWDYNQTNPARVCLNVNLSNSSYKVNAVMRYSSDDRVPEFYNIYGSTISLSNTPQRINLYDLLSSSSTEFLITYKDSDFLPVENALIQITRKYVSEGIFKTVEQPLTDDLGQAKGHFDLNSIIYTINVIKEGVVVATYDNVVLNCENTLIGDCKLNLNELTSTVSFTDYSNNKGIAYSFLPNLTSRTFSFTFSTLNGSVSTINLTGVKYDSFSNTTVCSDILTSSAGTLSCIVPSSYGNSTVIFEIYVDDELFTTFIYSLGTKAGDYFGDDVIIFILMIFITIPLMFINDPVIFLISTVFTLIIAVSLLFLSGGSIIGVSSFIIYWAIVIGLSVWKINKIRGGG